MAGTLNIGSKTLATHSSSTGIISLESSVDIKGNINATGSAPIYACRAWVNFDGVAINGASNNTSCIRGGQGITSVSERSAGRYELNLSGSFLLPSIGVCVVASCSRYDFLSGNDSYGDSVETGVYQVTSTTSKIRLNCGHSNSTYDQYQVHAAIFY